MALLQQSTAAVRMFFLGAGLAGVASTISKNGGAFAAAAGGAPAAVGALGWYKQALTVADTNTLGDLAYHFVAGVGVPAQQTADQIANWFTTTRVNADLKEWLTAAPAALDASGLVQVDVLRAVNVLLTAPTAGGLLKTDVETWLTAVPAVLDASGLVQVDLIQWKGTVPRSLTAHNLVQVDLEEWQDAVPTVLDGAGLVQVNVQDTAAALTFNLTGDVTGDLSGSVGSVAAAITLPANPPAGFLVTASYGTAPAWYTAPPASVILSAVQPLYAPSIAGDQMDLVNGPNATAMTAFATTLLGLANGLVAGFTTRQAMRILIAALYGKSTTDGTTRVYRNVEDTVDAITATVDSAGQRFVVVLDPS